MMNERWQKFKGYLAGAIALITCPCHLPITFPLLLSLTTGTALGSWLVGKFWLIFIGSTVIFMGGLGLAMWWHRQAEKPGNAQRKLAPAPVSKRRRAPNGKPVTVTLVTSAVCESCARAENVWEQVALSHPLQITTVDINSPRGRELVGRYNIFTTPTTLIGDRVVLRGVPTRTRARQILRGT